MCITKPAQFKMAAGNTLIVLLQTDNLHIGNQSLPIGLVAS